MLGNEPVRVLVVEDDESSRTAVQETLRLAGFEVFSAKDGGEALDRMHASHPCLVVLDLKLPVVDGYAVLQQMERTPGLADVPVVAYTAAEYDGRLKRCVSYLKKPVASELLVDTVRRWCGDPLQLDQPRTRR